MTKAKWNEQCWNCGSRHMVEARFCARCKDCGATATPPVRVGIFPMAHIAVSQGGDPADVFDCGNSPSNALVAKVQKERETHQAEKPHAAPLATATAPARLEPAPAEATPRRTAGRARRGTSQSGGVVYGKE